jgi:hypothetical protein
MGTQLSPIIITDIDGVLCDMVGRIQCWLFRYFDFILPEHCITTYDWPDSIPKGYKLKTLGANELPEADFKALIRKQVVDDVYLDEHVLMELNPYWSVLHALRYLPLHVVTGRPESTRLATKFWLDKFCLNTIHLGMPTREGKAEAMLDIARMHLDRKVLILEDDLLVVDRLLRYLRTDTVLKTSKIAVLVIWRPWNKKGLGVYDERVWDIPDTELHFVLDREGCYA